jgi:N-acetylglutamate synthase-like GNAT family acetyltransferase
VETVRPATAADAASIRALVRGAPRMNPTGLDWPNFVVAEHDGAVVGTAQLRPAGRGAVELGSLVVRADRRGRGLAGRLVAAALERSGGRVLVITAAAHAGFYRRRGFRPLPPWRAPPRAALHWAIGQAATRTRPIGGRWPRRMLLRVRPAAAAVAVIG